MPAQKNNITKGYIPFTALVLFSNMKKNKVLRSCFKQQIWELLQNDVNLGMHSIDFCD